MMTRPVDLVELAAEAAAKPAPVAAAKRRVLISVSQDASRYIPAGAVIEGFGKSFRINADHPSMHGAHLLGHEGSMGQYCYYYA